MNYNTTEKEFKKFNPGINKAHMYCNNRMFFELISINGVDVKKTFDLSNVVEFHSDNLLDDFDKTPVFNYEKGHYQEKVGGDQSKIIRLINSRSENGIWKILNYANVGLDSFDIGLRRIKNLKYLKDNAILNYSISENNPFCIILGYIDKNGMWMGNMTCSGILEGGGSPHKIDTGLITNLSSIFEEGSTIVDFGCGNADYIKKLISEGFQCEAYDGNPNTPEMTGGIGKVLDLSEKFDLNKKFDYVISLEVAEHIPKECEKIYVDNLIRHTGYYLITSWAVKGQGGDGHVNEQNEDYILDLYNKKGMVYQKEISESLRSIATLGWFKNTIYVFEKE